MLLGMQYAAVHPVRTKSVGNLLLMENRFGQIIAGAHLSISGSTAITQSCIQVRCAQVMHVTAVESFFEIEGLGVMCQPKCGGCRCGKCHAGGKEMTLKEEREFQQIEQGQSFDP